MKRVLLAASFAIVGLTACQVFFREGDQDAAGGGDALGKDSATGSANKMFVTDLTFVGNLGGRAGADDKCRVAALAGGLTGTFVAVLGDSHSGADVLALNRIGMARGWVRPDGAPVLENAADLISGRQWYPISLDQFGNDLGSNATYWSGSQPTGAVADDCNGWLDGTVKANGAFGHGQLAAGLGLGRQGCNQAVHLLCAAIDLQASITPRQGTGKHIFVSTISFGPNAAGRAAADKICATEAIGAQLAGTYLALLGTRMSTPISRFDGLAKYQRLDGQPVGFLSAAPLSFINRDAHNRVVNSLVWADIPTAIPVDNCEDWLVVQNAYGDLGRSNSAGSGAFLDFYKPFSHCGLSFPVYCVEQ